MALVRCIQQDSLRFLVENSLARLAKLVLDACHSVIHCPKDLSWGSDLKNSPYMYVNSPYPIKLSSQRRCFCVICNIDLF